MIKFLQSKGYTINIPKDITKYSLEEIKKILVKDKYGNSIVKIGKIFRKYNRNDLLEKYEKMCREFIYLEDGESTYLYGDGRPEQKLKILISKHPYDVGTMSTFKK